MSTPTARQIKSRQAHKKVSQAAAAITFEIEALLQQADCSNVTYVGDNPERWSPDYEGDEPAVYFEYLVGGNEGCYITIGYFQYRCHLAAPKLYAQAVSLYVERFADQMY